ncbi:NAD(P)-dependent oxidoreductase [Haloechinothrix sp. LS1_15]|uniref:NAD(P)-dependent oxidoreductase n=1 Tax=Haloechinothrix sp. LS1_15 TaxID=2652248 RepID=UPI002947F2B5|nr:NAD(P)-dependent oxidoreductase [Haloechinothrix sp. LS1_15]MDV6014095.1 NAD(P)-dependent oxidoreductase [Haloechinothrix sp. LS1_15]
MTTAGFIGLGNIGRPMALRLADLPGGLVVYDVDTAATAPLADSGAAVAGSITELAAKADIVCVMVRDDDQVREVIEELLAAGRQDQVVAVHSTVHPDTAVELATRAERHGVAVLDAPVSGGAMGAADGRLAILLGGADQAVARARPILERLGEVIVHFGPAGAGTKAKLARNLLHFVAFTAVTEAERLAESAGVDLEALGRVVRHTDGLTGGPGAIMLRSTTMPMVDDDPLRPIFEHVRELGEKDLRLAIELGDTLGVPTPLAKQAIERLAAGLGLAGDP